MSGLAELVVELSTENLKKDPNLAMTDQRRFKYSCHSRVKQALKRVQKEIQGTKPENFSALVSRKSSNLSTIRSISGGVRINNIPDKGECSSNNSINNIESLL